MLKKLWVGLCPGNQELHLQAPPQGAHLSGPLESTLLICPQAGGLQELPEWKAEHSTLSAESVDQELGSLPSAVPNHRSQTHVTYWAVAKVTERVPHSWLFPKACSSSSTHRLIVHSCKVLTHSGVFSAAAIAENRMSRK